MPRGTMSATNAARQQCSSRLSIAVACRRYDMAILRAYNDSHIIAFSPPPPLPLNSVSQLIILLVHSLAAHTLRATPT